MKVLCIGHATYDVVIPVDNYPVENTKNRVDSVTYCGGGPSSNAAYLLGKWGIDTYFCGSVGDDYPARVIESELKRVNVNLDYLIKDKNIKTTKSYIIVNKTNASRTTLSMKSKNKDINDIDISFKPDIILVDGHEAELSKKIINANKDRIVVIDAGKCTSDVIELCKLSDYIVCSKTFALDYTNSDDVNIMLERLNNDFAGEVVITLESDGCAYYDNGVKKIKSIPVKAVDTTGAGDIFHGAFVYGIANNWDMYKILTFASVASGLSVTKLTGRKSVFPLNIVEDVYNELRRRNFY